jgi:hypothetical protein
VPRFGKGVVPLLQVFALGMTDGKECLLGFVELGNALVDLLGSLRRSQSKLRRFFERIPCRIGWHHTQGQSQTAKSRQPQPPNLVVPDHDSFSSWAMSAANCLW